MHTLMKHLRMRKRLFLSVIVGLFSLTACDWWPAKREPNSHTQIWVYKLREDLILAMVPIERENEPLDKAALRRQFPNPQPPPDGTVSGRNAFYMPGATSPDDTSVFYNTNTTANMGKPLDLNVVSGPYITPWTDEMYRMQSDAGRDARIGWKSLTRAEYAATHPVFEMHGMQCYVRTNESNAMRTLHWQVGDCLAERAPGEWAIFEFGNGPSGYIKTEYFTKAYGGLSVRWIASYRNFSRWREIDAKLWRLVDERNLAKKP